MSAAEDVRMELHRLIEALPASQLAELARAAEQLRRRSRRQARLEWVSEFVRRLPEPDRPRAWTALLWLIGEKTAEPTLEERRALHNDPSDAVAWATAKQEMGL